MSEKDASSIPSIAAIFALSWPMALKAMMLQGIVVIDSLLVAPLGEMALAAMGLAAAVFGLVMGSLFAFSNATQIRVAQAYGADEAKSLKSGFYIGLMINLGVTVIGLVLIAVFGTTIINAFAHSPEVGQQAWAYVQVFCIVLVAEAVGQCLSSHFNGCGNSRLPFISYVIALPINVGLSAVLIHGMFGFPEWGVVGAAVGSAVSSSVRVLFLAWKFWKIDGAYIGVEGWRHGGMAIDFRRHLAFALPIAATFISVSLANQVCTLMYAKMSVNHFAAMTLILPWVMVAGTLMISWAQATGIFVAQMLGQGRKPEDLDIFLSRAWRWSFLPATFVALAYLTFCLLSGWIYGALERETTLALLSFLPVLLIVPFPKISNAICGNTLRAANDTVYVMRIFLVGQWACRVPVTAVLVLVLGAPVAWIFAVHLLEELVKFPLFHKRLWKGDWKTREV